MCSGLKHFDKLALGKKEASATSSNTVVRSGMA